MSLETISEPQRMRERSRAARAAGRRIGLVPTMGCLHDGHLSLVRRARSECDVAVASIFVNPAQFGPEEDFARYPRELGRDRALLEREGADVLYHPDRSDVYPAGHATWVTVERLSEGLCGRRRPGHFRGVATVVTKLLNVVEPDAVFFGQKDAQQAILIKRMVRDLDLPVRVEVCPTVREEDGLAMSSRNAYLSPREREAAPVIYRALAAASAAARAGERSPRVLIERAGEVLAGEPVFHLEYLELVSASDLEPVAGDRLAGDALLAAAGRIGGTRLIDNVIIPAKN